MGFPAALILGLAVILAAVARAPAVSVQAAAASKAGSAAAIQDAAAGPRPFFVGCPANLAGTPWEDDIERKQSQWFFKAKTLKMPLQSEVTYSHGGSDNSTACDPMLGPVVASKWAGLSQGMITLAPEGPAGSKHIVDLSQLEKGVQYWITDTRYEAWQRYRSYTPITIVK